MITKKNILSSIYVMIACATCIGFTACSKMDDTYNEFIKGGEIRYSERPDTIGVYPGHNRAKVWLAVSSKNISKFKVYWNDRADSVEVDVDQGINSTNDTIGSIIENLAEGSYTFEFFTFDNEGNSSIVVDTTGDVYGENYVSGLNPRLMQTAGLINGKVNILWFDESNPHSIGTEIRYKDKAEKEHTVKVKTNEEVTRIANRPLNDVIEYRTLFLPHTQSIDTFYTEYSTVQLEDAVPIELDKEKFVEFKLPTDATLSRYSKGMYQLWDGQVSNTTFYGTDNNVGNPHWFTFDMGVNAGLSKLIYWQRAYGSAAGERLLYANANARVFEVWGSNDPNPDGSWDSWTKLMTCESIKPSGLPLGSPLTDEDLNQARDGETFTFPEDTPPMRYIRIKVLDTWDPSMNTRSFMAELSLYGVAE